MTSCIAGSWSRAARQFGRAALAMCLTGTSALAVAHDNDRSGSMLALGDSVVFGYITADGPAYLNPTNFLGYPEIVGDSLGLDVANASCPGETTSGFLSLSGDDNGCRTFRANFPLHERYTTSQFDYALAYLGANKRKTRLVTVSLGANDGFRLLARCQNDPACIQANLPSALGLIFANLNSTLSNIRATGFKGVLMVVNYFSLDYGDASQTGLTVALNQALAGAAAANGAVVADAFTAFQKAATPAGGKTCFAALLNGNPANQTQCDVHPSLSGQRLLARTVEATYRSMRRGDD